MKRNYHTHNYRCNHSEGTVEEYVAESIRSGYDEIGISDHLPHPGKNIDNKSRMKYDELPSYIMEIDEAIKKYGDKISIKKGMECEYFPDYEWVYNELIETHKMDYLLLGVHFFPYKGQWRYVGHVRFTPEVLETYVDFVIEAMKSGLFKCIVHPDLFGISYLNWDEHTIKQSRRIFEAAEELDMPIEINVNGMKKSKVKYNNGKRYQYPIKEFWELSKEYKVKRIIGIDAHDPSDMRDFNIGLEFCNELGLDVIDKLEF